MCRSTARPSAARTSASRRRSSSTAGCCPSTWRARTAASAEPAQTQRTDRRKPSQIANEGFAMNRLMTHPGAVRVLAPTLLGIVLLLTWQIVCKVLAVPVYLVPMPTDIFDTLVQDWTLLTSALMVTLKIT